MTSVKRRYHHGDLANALLDEAERQLESAGIESLSLRALAQAVGVASSAPYRHFSGREELLAGLIRRGYERVHQSYVDVAAARGKPRDRLLKACRAYVQFAEESPQLFRLIFVSGRELPSFTGSSDHPGRRAFELFRELVAAAVPEPLRPAELDTRTVALLVSIHGLAVMAGFHANSPLLSAGPSVDKLLVAVVAPQLASCQG